MNKKTKADRIEDLRRGYEETLARLEALTAIPARGFDNVLTEQAGRTAGQSGEKGLKDRLTAARSWLASARREELDVEGLKTLIPDVLINPPFGNSAFDYESVYEILKEVWLLCLPVFMDTNDPDFEALGEVLKGEGGLAELLGASERWNERLWLEHDSEALRRRLFPWSPSHGPLPKAGALYKLEAHSTVPLRFLHGWVYDGEPGAHLLDTLDTRFGAHGHASVDVLVREGAGKEETITTLKRITAYLEEHWDRLTDPERDRPELYS